jgi:hypothetical protein
MIHSNNQALSVAQLQALDTNNDGQLTGSETNIQNHKKPRLGYNQADQFENHHHSCSYHHLLHKVNMLSILTAMLMLPTDNLFKRVK